MRGPNRSSELRAIVVALLVPAALLRCAKSEEGGDDGGVFDPGHQVARCIPDRANTPETAIPVPLGEIFTGGVGSELEICPPTDRDFYKFDIPANVALVTIEVGYPSMASSPVEVSFEVFRAPDMMTPVASGQDEIAADNRSTLKKTFFLGLAAASYVMRVRDVGDDEQDVHNHYQVKITTAADLDVHEPNNTCAEGTAFALANSTGMASGAITFQGDVDAYRVTISAGSKMVDATLSIPMTTPVDAKISLLSPSGKFLTALANPRGEMGGTNVHLRFGLESAGGDYCLVVEDDDARDADPAATYNLAVKLEDESDPQETAHRNDTPDTATDLGSNGGTRTGRIGSRADFDWFKISGAVGSIVEIHLECPGCGIQPAISLVYGDPSSPCGASSACDYLLEPGRTCMVDGDCDSKVCREVPGGTKRCAAHCSGDEANLDCPSFQCNQVGNVGACVGAATCTAGKCGVLQYSDTAAMDSVTTAEPIKSSPSYILVHDFQDDQFAVADYTLTVTIVGDPEGRPDSDSFYFSDGRATIDQKLGRSRMLARPIPWVPAPGGGKMASGAGCISYKGDFDVFRLEGGNPCAATASVSGGNCGLFIDYDRPMGPVDHLYAIYTSSFRQTSNFLLSAEGTETRFGDEDGCPMDPLQRECFVYNFDERGDLFVVVRDLHGPLSMPRFDLSQWDTNPNHCYRFTVYAGATAGCPTSCPMVMNGYCTCPRP